MQIGPDMLVSGFLQPLPDIVPPIPSLEETFIVDPTVSPYESSIIFFYKTWDPYGALSNFSPHPVEVPDENGDYVTWLSVEHYYQVLTILPKFSIFLLQNCCIAYEYNLMHRHTSFSEWMILLHKIVLKGSNLQKVQKKLQN